MLAALAGALVHSTGGGALIGGPVADRLQRERRAAEVRPVRPDVALIGVSPSERADWPRAAPGLLRALDSARAEVAGFLPPLAAGQPGLVLEPPFAARAFLLDGGSPPGAALAPAGLEADPDGVVRWLTLTGRGGRASLVARLAGSLGASAQPGLVDYGLGRPFDYEPLETLLRWEQAGDFEALEKKLRGRPVLVGPVGEGAPHRATPVAVAGWVGADSGTPEVAVHGQALRTLIAGRAIAPVPGWLTAVVVAVAAGVAGLGRRPVLATVLTAAGGAALLYADAWLLARGTWLPPAGPVVSLLTGWALVISRPNT